MQSPPTVYRELLGSSGGGVGGHDTVRHGGGTKDSRSRRNDEYPRELDAHKAHLDNREAVTDASLPVRESGESQPSDQRSRALVGFSSRNQMRGIGSMSCFLPFKLRPHRRAGARGCDNDGGGIVDKSTHERKFPESDAERAADHGGRVRGPQWEVFGGGPAPGSVEPHVHPGCLGRPKSAALFLGTTKKKRPSRIVSNLDSVLPRTSVESFDSHASHESKGAFHDRQRRSFSSSSSEGTLWQFYNVGFDDKEEEKYVFNY